MVKSDTISLRVNVELAKWINEIADKNNLTKTQASKELVKLKKRMGEDKKKIIREIKF